MWDIGTQKAVKIRTEGCQTDVIEKGGQVIDGAANASSFGHISDSAEQFIDHQTVNSTNNLGST